MQEGIRSIPVVMIDQAVEALTQARLLIEEGEKLMRLQTKPKSTYDDRRECSTVILEELRSLQDQAKAQVGAAENAVSNLSDKIVFAKNLSVVEST